MRGDASHNEKHPHHSPQRRVLMKEIPTGHQACKGALCGLYGSISLFNSENALNSIHLLFKAFKDVSLTQNTGEDGGSMSKGEAIFLHYYDRFCTRWPNR